MTIRIKSDNNTDGGSGAASRTGLLLRNSNTVAIIH